MAGIGSMLAAGLLQGLTKNIENAQQGKTEEAKLLGQLMGLAPELPEDLRSQIPTVAPESRMSEIASGFGLASRTNLDSLRRLTAQVEGWNNARALAKERKVGEGLKNLLSATTPVNQRFSSVGDMSLDIPGLDLAYGGPGRDVTPDQTTYETTTQGSTLPQNLRTYLGMAAATDPLGALKEYGQYLLREPQKPTVLNQRPGSRALLLGPTGQVTETIEGPPATAPREAAGPEILQLQRALQAMDDGGVPQDSPTRLPIINRIKRLAEGAEPRARPIDPVLNRRRELLNELTEKQLAGTLTDKEHIATLRSIIAMNERAIRDTQKDSPEETALKSEIFRDRSQLNRLLAGIRNKQFAPGLPTPVTPNPATPGGVTPQPGRLGAPAPNVPGFRFLEE